MKFKVGDRFMVKPSESDLNATGTITGIGFNSIYQSDEYKYVWDQEFGGTAGSCDIEVGDSMWEFTSHVFTAPSDGHYHVSIGNIYTKPKGECSHEYKMYNGFSESYEFCIKCDKRKV